MIRINLLPPELRKKKRFILIDKTLLYIVFAMIILVFLLNFITTQQKARISRLEEDIASVQAELVHYKHITELVSRIEQARAKIESRIDEFRLLDKQRAYWVRHFSLLAEHIPEFVWFGKYDQTKTDIVISGVSYSIQNIATLMVQFLKGQVFDKLSLSYIKETVVKEYGTAYAFELKSGLPTVTVKKEEKKGPRISEKIKKQLGTREEAKKAAEAFK